MLAINVTKDINFNLRPYYLRGESKRSIVLRPNGTPREVKYVRMIIDGAPTDGEIAYINSCIEKGKPISCSFKNAVDAMLFFELCFDAFVACHRSEVESV